MTPVFLVLLFFMLAVVPPGATENELSMDIAGILRRANAGIKTPMRHGDIMENPRRNAAPCTAAGCLWPKVGEHVIVPVTISRKYKRRQRKTISDSLLTFHETTCIRFVPKNETHKDFIEFIPSTGCWSYLGRQSGGQQISLQTRGCLYPQIVQHEVLHALGFHHEQVRSDRDEHVTILTENIISGKESNFEKVETNNLGTPYDFDSVMHYGNYAFSKNEEPTIVAKNDPDLIFGEATEMSDNDIDRINILYECYAEPDPAIAAP